MDGKQTDDHSNQFPYAHLPGQVISPGQPSSQQASPPDLTTTQPVTPQATLTPQNPSNTPLAQSQPSPSVVHSGHMSPSAPKPKKSKLPLLISLVIVFLLLAGGGAYAAIHLNANKPKTNTNTSSNSKKKSTGSTKTPSTTATAVTCTSETCFSPYFTSCTPATFNAAITIASTKYQIYGKKGSGCSMLVEYTANPNSAWVNQPMTCDFDNTQSLDNSTTAVFNSLFAKQNTYDCTGPLVAILESQ